MAIAPTRDGRTVTTGEVRLAFEHLFEKWSGENGNTPAFSAVFMIPKNDDGKRTMQALLAAQKEAQAEGAKSKWKNDEWLKEHPDELASVLRDGDKDKMSRKYEEFKGHWFFTARDSRNQPVLVNRAKQEILERSELYSGAFVRARVQAFPYNTAGNAGVSFGLELVQKLRDGESLGGHRPSANTMLGELDDVAGDDDSDEQGVDYDSLI